MRKLDAEAINDCGIASSVLMENAAGHLAAAVLERLPEGGAAAVVCGTGNNGGDGVAAARILLERGVRVKTYLVGDRGRMTEDERLMESRLVAAGGELLPLRPGDAAAERYVSGADVIVDALFGVGLSRALSGEALEAVRLINRSRAYTVSADVASGVDAGTGEILGEAVRADETVTFTFAKPGHFAAPGCERRGRLSVCDIGIPERLAAGAPSAAEAVDTVCLPRRKMLTHKGDYGRILVIAGSVGFTGAPILASRAAVRAGAGLVFLGVPERIYTAAAVKSDEAMPFPLPCGEDGTLSDAAVGEVLARLSRCDACLIGPGLGRSEGVADVVAEVVRECRVPLVIDADGINAVSEHRDILRGASCPIILAPHDGEFARLGGAIAGGRPASARAFALEYGCTLILKGPGTVTAGPDGELFINTNGNPGMAKGGSGDVLSGITAALLGQGLAPTKAAYTAVYLHGRAGDICAGRYGEYAMTATDMIGALSDAFMESMG